MLKSGVLLQLCWSYCSQLSCWCSPAHVTIKGQVDIHGRCCHLKPCCCPWASLQRWGGLRAIWGHVDVYGPWCRGGEGWGLSKAMLMSMGHAATRDPTEVNGMHWFWRLWGCLWCMLSPETMWEYIFQLTKKGQASYSWKRETDIEGLRTLPPLRSFFISLSYQPVNLTWGIIVWPDKQFSETVDTSEAEAWSL